MEALDIRPVLIAWAELQADTMGAKKCAKKGVGGLIRRLKAHLTSGVPGLLGKDALRTVQLLESHCRLCGKCSRADLQAAE